jgi:hypothetical protein
MIPWLAIFVLSVTTAIIFVIAYAAWRGYPKTFTWDSYALLFILAGVAAVVLLTLAQRMHPEGTWELILMGICGYSSFLVLGVSVGCGASVFVLFYRQYIARSGSGEH